MKIEYTYHKPKRRRRSRQKNQQNALGCFILALFLLCFLCILFALLPLILAILGWSILILGSYIIYKNYLESYVLNFIQKHNLRR